MKRIGFSTGAISRGDFRRAIDILARLPVNAIELSALRMNELDPLLSSLDSLPLDKYAYIAFHAPGRFNAEEERTVISRLHAIKDRGWPIIVHPDALIDRRAWRPLGPSLCFENMDKRKPIGRTADELSSIFAEFDDASLCFDVGHASQVDRTMAEAYGITQRFKSRIRQIHVSEVNTKSEHVAITAVSELAFAKIAGELDHETPIIIESVTAENKLQEELDLVSEIFSGAFLGIMETD